MTKDEILAAAYAELRALADGAGIGSIARALDVTDVGPDLLAAFLGHQLAKGHAAMLRLSAKIDHYLALISPDRPPEEQDRGVHRAVQLSAASARLLEGYRLGLLSLAKLKGWKPPAPRAALPDLAAFGIDPDFDEEDPDDHPDGGPNGGPCGPKGGNRANARLLAQMRAARAEAERELARFNAEFNGAKPNGNGTHLAAKPRSERATPCPASDSERTNAQLPASDSEWTTAKVPASARQGIRPSGQLRNGNPSGDLAAVPRCGAATRAGTGCRQPAMKSPRGGGGRCRLHGGKSTGARTAAGLARCRTASLVHGDRTAEIIELRSATARSSRALRVLARAVAVSAEPQSERATPCPASDSERTNAQLPASDSEWTTTKFPARRPARTAPRRAAGA